MPLSIIWADTVSLLPSGIHQTDYDFALLFLGTAMVVQCLEQHSPGTCAVVNKKTPHGSSCRIAFGQHCKEKPETLSLPCKLSQQLKIFTSAIFTCWCWGREKKRKYFFQLNGSQQCMQTEVNSQITVFCISSWPSVFELLHWKQKLKIMSAFLLTIIKIQFICTRFVSFLLVFAATTRMKDIMQWTYEFIKEKPWQRGIHDCKPFPGQSPLWVCYPVWDYAS